MSAAPERDRLAAAMNRRRAQLGLDWEGVAQAGGISVATLRRIRSGIGNLTLDAKIAVERGLRWAEGSVDAILDGGTPAETAEPARSTREADQRNVQRILDASAAELVRMFREEVEARPGMTRAHADQWLVDVLEMRAHALRLEEAAKRSAS